MGIIQRAALLACLCWASIADARSTRTNLRAFLASNRQAPEFTRRLTRSESARNKEKEAILELLPSTDEEHRALGYYGYGQPQPYTYYGYEYSSSKSKGKGKKKKKGKGKGKGGKGKGYGYGYYNGGYGYTPPSGAPPVYPPGTLPQVCDRLSFPSPTYGSRIAPAPTVPDHSHPLYTYTGGKGYRRKTRELQFDGALCQGNVLDIARQIPQLSTFVQLVEAAFLEPIFVCEGPFTLAIPSNDAFAANPSLVEYLTDPNNLTDLRDVLLNHIVPGLYLTEDLGEGVLRTLQGSDVEVGLSPLALQGAQVLEADIFGCNGALNIIGDVLIPPDVEIVPDFCGNFDFTLQGSINHFFNRRLQSGGEGCSPNVVETLSRFGALSTFVELLEIAGLTELFLCSGPFTVFAPQNSAFDALDAGTIQELSLPENRELLQNLLLYHIVPGMTTSSGLQAGDLSTLFIGESIGVAVNPMLLNGRAVILQADNNACNGVFHIIDDVLVPETNVCDMFTFDTSANSGSSGTGCTPNIVDVAGQYPELSLTATLLDRVDLMDIFNCGGPFTAVLPSNAAWDRLDPTLLEFLLRPENQELLEDVLLYHIFPGRMTTNQFVSGSQATLLPTDFATVALNPLTIDGNQLDTIDVPACNGVISIVREVLVPSRIAPSPPSQPATPAPQVQIQAPTAAPGDFCSQYTFNRRRLQDTTCSPNILDAARQRSDLSLTVSLFERSGLEELFDCPGPFTAIFPSNSAIESIDPALLEFLLRPENSSALQSLLLYHILPGSQPTSGLLPVPVATLSSGRTVDVSLSPISFNNNEVLTADIQACNGLINVIGAMLTFPGGPTNTPTRRPTLAPTLAPTNTPTVSPTQRPTVPPGSPTMEPTTASPTVPPTAAPTGSPTSAPTNSPTVSPTARPTVLPGNPTMSPTTASPTASPTATPTVAPAVGPTVSPVMTATAAPTPAPSVNVTMAPSMNGTIANDTAIGPTVSPTIAPTAMATDPPNLRIRVADYYLAYVAPNAQAEPTEEQYEYLANVTNQYFQDFLETAWADDPAINFLGSETALEFTLWEQGIPAANFNIYMDYAYTDLIFTPDSTPPDAGEAFAILRDSISTDYILSYVRSDPDSPFISTNEVVFRASTMTAPLNRSADRSEGSSTAAQATLIAASAAALLVAMAAGVTVYRRKRYNRDFVDGIYATEGKVLEGYFSEHSVTEQSDNNSRFPPLQRVDEEVFESQADEVEDSEQPRV